MTEVEVVWIEGDNANAIKPFHKSLISQFWLASYFTSLDLSFLNDFKLIIFNSIFREENKVVDYCTTYALNGSFLWDFLQDNLPSDFISLLKEECDRLAIN